MKTKIICILDASGSMCGIINDAIGGFNTFLKEQQEVDGIANIDILLFDTNFKKIVDSKDIRQVKPLTIKEYYPGGGTSLYDAIGMSIDNELDKLAETQDYRFDKTLVVILTDGEENSSRKYHQGLIKNMITEMEEEFNWDFIFLAANQDAILTADGMGIKAGKSMNWSADAEGVTFAYSSISKATKLYRTTTKTCSESYDNIFKDSEEL